MADPILLIENFFYCFVRFVGLVMIMPYVGSNSFPTKVKAILAYVVSLVCFLSLPESAYFQASHDLEILIVVVKEFLIGMIMGLGVKVVTETLMFAGSIVSTPIGLSIATAIDPASGENSSTIGQFNTTLGSFLFFVINGHHYTFEALQRSFRVIGFNDFVFSSQHNSYFINLFYELFMISLQIAMPILCVAILIQFSLGVIVRTMPKLNIFMIGIPIQICLGMITYVISLPFLVKIIKVLYFDAFNRLLPDIARFAKL